MTDHPNEPVAPPHATDDHCAARHLCMLLVTARPDLWPLLNAATLGDRTDWPDVLRQLEHAAGMRRAA